MFFHTEEEMKFSERNGTRLVIEERIILELKRQERWEDGRTTIAFEYDSDENVRDHFDGNYYQRLH